MYVGSLFVQRIVNNIQRFNACRYIIRMHNYHDSCAVCVHHFIYTHIHLYSLVYLRFLYEYLGFFFVIPSHQYISIDIHFTTISSLIKHCNFIEPNECQSKYIKIIFTQNKFFIIYNLNLKTICKYFMHSFYNKHNIIYTV